MPARPASLPPNRPPAPGTWWATTDSLTELRLAKRILFFQSVGIAGGAAGERCQPLRPLGVASWQTLTAAQRMPGLHAAALRACRFLPARRLTHG